MNIKIIDKHFSLHCLQKGKELGYSGYGELIFYLCSVILISYIIEVKYQHLIRIPSNIQIFCSDLVTLTLSIMKKNWK